MKSIDFTAIPIRLSIDSTDTIEADLKSQIANLIYTQTTGIASHALALKLFNAEKEVELSEEEIIQINQIIERLSTPAMIDSIKALLNESDEQISKE